MRKRLVLLVLFVIVFLAGLAFFFIPGSIVIKKSIGARSSAKAFSRAIFDETTWPQWWPQLNKNDKSFPTALTYHDNTYSLVEKRLSSLLISIRHGSDSLLAELVVIPVDADSVELNWLGTISTSANPLKRVQKNHWAHAITKDLDTLLQGMRSYYANPDHLYSLQIREEKVVDSTLISTFATFPSYPSTENIYGLLEKLNRFVRKNEARQTGLPMLNISRNPDGMYLTKVALPVDKKLKDEGDIQYRWMLGGGNILVTDVVGGPAQIEKAFRVIEQYIDENQRTAPAIPFQSLVTDRRAETDTAKWVTKVYWPVM